VTEADVATARAHLVALAHEPRAAGSAAEARARAYCAEHLRALGFAAVERPFDYSAFPGRWATPLVGVLSIVGIMAAGHVGYGGAPGLSLSILVATLALLALGGGWLARRGVLDAPWLRARGVNLECTRGEGAPRLWLVAHVDSKSQPVPILVRAAGIALTAILWIAAIALALVQLAGAMVPAWSWQVVAIVGSAASLPIAASVVGARSPGALDNASGVAAVLLAAERIGRDAPLGVLLTSAEELGLAGARAWARGAPVGVALNVDSLDDAGALTCMWSGRRPTRLLDAASATARSLGLRCGTRRLVPGILTDGVAVADAGWETFTLSRGTLATLARIHRPADRVEDLEGSGVAEAALLLERLVRDLVH
jgi:hypothetical protein